MSIPAQSAPVAKPAIDLAQARAFLYLLDPTASLFTFQTFDDVEDADGHKRNDKRLAKIFHGTLDQVAPKLADLQCRGAGVFVCVNATDGRGRKTANITRIRAVWRELDEA